MLLLLAATAQVDDATLRQRETNPEHQEAELRTALRDAVGTDSRDGAWEKFKLEALADNYGFDPRSNAKLRDMLKAAGHGPLDFCHPDVIHDPLIAQWQRGMDLQLAAGAERKWSNARASSDAPLDTYCRLVSACMIATEDAFAIEQEAVGNYEELYGGAPGAAFDFLSEFLAVATEAGFMPAWWDDEHTERLLWRANVPDDEHRQEKSHCYIRSRQRWRMSDLEARWGAKKTRTLRALAAAVWDKMPADRRRQRSETPADQNEIFESFERRLLQLASDWDADRLTEPMVDVLLGSIWKHGTLTAAAFVRLDELIPAQQDYMRALGGALPHGIPRAGKASDATAAVDEFRFMASTSDADARKLARAETRWEGTDLDDLSPAEIRRFLFVEAMRLRVAHVAPEAIEGAERGGERLRSKVSAAGESISIT